MFFCFSVNKMMGTYSRFIWCYKLFPSFINQCLPPFTFGFVFWKSVRLHPQFVWVTSIIITYSNTTPVLSNHIFRFFLSAFFNDNFVALFTFCLQIFHLQTSQKKWRDTKVQSPICHSRKMAAENRESFVELNFLIHVVIAQSFDPTAECVVPTETQTN